MKFNGSCWNFSLIYLFSKRILKVQDQAIPTWWTKNPIFQERAWFTNHRILLFLTMKNKGIGKLKLKELAFQSVFIPAHKLTIDWSSESKSLLFTLDSKRPWKHDEILTILDLHGMITLSFENETHASIGLICQFRKSPRGKGSWSKVDRRRNKKPFIAGIQNTHYPTQAPMCQALDYIRNWNKLVRYCFCVSLFGMGNWKIEKFEDWKILEQCFYGRTAKAVPPRRQVSGCPLKPVPPTPVQPLGSSGQVVPTALVRCAFPLALFSVSIYTWLS